MQATRQWGSLLLATALVSGCMVPKSEFDALRVQNQSLQQQTRAQTAQIENLGVHSRNIEDQLARAEESLALMQDRLGLTQKQLGNFQREREQLYSNVDRGSQWKSRMPAGVSTRLAEIARRYPSLQFDPQSGVAKLDTDILFDSGTDQVKPGAEEVLAELVKLMKMPEAKDLRLMVVGHTDDRQIAGRPVREKFGTNFHLSAGRALAVAEQLQKLGLTEDRMGVAGFGAHQPVATNTTAKERLKNRRVEIFLVAPEVPVIGWTESIPTVY